MLKAGELEFILVRNTDKLGALVLLKDNIILYKTRDTKVIECLDMEPRGHISLCESR